MCKTMIAHFRNFFKQLNIVSQNLLEERILKIIKDLNPNKASGFDEISVKMIQLCDDSIILPLAFIFRNALDSEVFPSNWKKGM